MMWRAIATDYDGTLAFDGKVTPETIAALQRARGAGIRLILVTGRELADLFNTFEKRDTFDLIVGENGAVVFDPATGQLTLLAEPPSQALVDALTKEHVPFSTGHSIVATTEPYHPHVVRAIAAGQLPWQVITNKGAIMALPQGVSKRTGLVRALAVLDLEPDRTIAIGDAENDADMLRFCGLAVAVDNALPMLKDLAHVVTTGARGEGVQELVERVLTGELDRDMGR